MLYGLATTTGYIKSDEIIAQLDPSVPLQLAHIQAIKNLERNGCRYCNQDFDVLAAAYRAIGETTIAPYEQKWVDAMTAEASK